MNKGHAKSVPLSFSLRALRPFSACSAIKSYVLSSGFKSKAAEFMQ
jgi:hypothetical protein